MDNKNVKELSLNLNKRKAETNQREDQALSQLNTYRRSLGLENVTAETRKDNPLPGEEEHWKKVYHEEAARILLDENNWSGNVIATDSDTPAALTN